MTGVRQGLASGSRKAHLSLLPNPVIVLIASCVFLITTDDEERSGCALLERNACLLSGGGIMFSFAFKEGDRRSISKYMALSF
jgi:hypothetical protein